MEITLVVFDSESFALSDKIFAGVDQFIDENYVGEKTAEEYSPVNLRAGLEAHVADECAEEPIERKAARRERNRNERRGLFGSGSNAMRMDSAIPPVAAAGAACASVAPRSLEDVVKNVSETWQESLLRLITERGYSDTEVYKRANVDRKLFSKIRTNKNYQPKKNTAVAFALALRLNLDETKDFLMRAGYAFSPSSKFDLIIEYSIEHGVYDLMLINGALFDHDQPQLGA